MLRKENINQSSIQYGTLYYFCDLKNKNNNILVGNSFKVEAETGCLKINIRENQRINQETLATLGTQNTGRKQTTQTK
jgi:hypothetical protein